MPAESTRVITGADGRTVAITTDASGETTRVVTDADGSTSVVTLPPGREALQLARSGEVPHEEQMPPMAAFVIGVMLGALLLWAFQLWGRRAARRAAAAPPEPDQVAGELAALRRRTAVLERIATDPANRVEREIEALR